MKKNAPAKFRQKTGQDNCLLPGYMSDLIKNYPGKKSVLVHFGQVRINIKKLQKKEDGFNVKKNDDS